MSLWGFIRGQFLNLAVPTVDCAEKTIIVTGANIGLGREAARHFTRLGAAKVILACRRIHSAQEARNDIQESTRREGVVEVWELDLSSFDSIREFVSRVDKLERLDVLLNNAGVQNIKVQMTEEYEHMLLVNVISTFFLSIMILPTLRRTAVETGTTPRISTVCSDGVFMVQLPEAQEDSVFGALNSNTALMRQYNVSKLLQLMVMKRLGEAVDASGKGHVLVNAVNPGLCRTELWRAWPFPLSVAGKAVNLVLGRTAEIGSRTLVAAALAGEETHAHWMSDCQLYVWPKIMKGEDGEALTSRVWEELLDILETIEPGMKSII